MVLSIAQNPEVIRQLRASKLLLPRVPLLQPRLWTPKRVQRTLRSKHNTFTIVQDQDAGAGGSAVTTLTATFDSTPTDNNLGVAALYKRNTEAVTGPSGWTEAVSHVFTSSEVEVWYRVFSGDGTGVTFSWASSVHAVLVIGEWTLPTATPFDTSAVADSGGNVTTLAIGPTGTTDQSDELLIGVLATRGGHTNSFSWASEALTHLNDIETAGGNNNKAGIGWGWLDVNGVQTWSTTPSWSRSETAGGILTTWRESVAADDMSWYDRTPVGVEQRVVARAY